MRVLSIYLSCFRCEFSAHEESTDANLAIRAIEKGDLLPILINSFMAGKSVSGEAAVDAAHRSLLGTMPRANAALAGFDQWSNQLRALR